MKYRKESWLNPKIEVRDPATHDKGMLANVPIMQGETVAIWGGNFVKEGEAFKAKKEGMAVQQIGADLFDVFDYEKRNEDPTYNHNHSCDPNTWMKDEVTIIARRDINPDEELTIDYAMFVIDDNYIMQGECECGSTFCRHIITGKDWQRKDIQERYENHFSPYFNEQIKKMRIK